MLTDEMRGDVEALRPGIAASRADAERLRRLPDPIVKTFVERDVYRTLLPRSLGGRGVDPLELFDAIVEVAALDGSVAWNYALGGTSGMLAGVMDPDTARAMFAEPTCAIAGSGPPQGRAVRVQGGYRVSGSFSWASGIYQSVRVLGGCFVYEGEERATGPGGVPVVVHAIMPTEEVTILDTWHTGGMRGTGSTQFTAEDVFVPAQHAVTMFGAEPKHPDPIFRLPTSFFGFGLSAVPFGIAREAVEGLKSLATNQSPQPPRPGMVDQPHLQYTVAKVQAMTEAARHGLRAAFADLWNAVRTEGAATVEARARLRGAMVHGVETCVEAVQLCYRAAGGAALFEEAPFERALRDVNAIAGHIVFQRVMMEDAGRVSLGLKPLLPMF